VRIAILTLSREITFGAAIMKVAIMLRHLTQHGGGVLVYSQQLLKDLLSLETSHEFVLIYNDKRFLGSYNQFDHVREIAIESSSPLLWDQWALARLERREKFDVIFNPKYSVPLMARCPTVFVCHGLDWYVMPWGSKWVDRLSHMMLIPRYARKATRIIAVSETTKEHLHQYLGVPSGKVSTIYHGIDPKLKAPVSTDALDSLRKKHALPDQFLLYCGQIYPPKNFGRLLSAYAQVGPKLGIPLVIAGEHRWLCGKDLALIETLGISSWVKRIGWVGREELPALYRLAHALLLPSLYESFGIPLIEAMACECPVLTSNRFGTKEIVGDAGLLVEPEDVQDIADGIHGICTDRSLRERLIQAGRKRAAGFSWTKCAQQTLDALEQAACIDESTQLSRV
jgi:glycosyltransferase involved in cell wall biosynthesis